MRSVGHLLKLEMLFVVMDLPHCFEGMMSSREVVAVAVVKCALCVGECAGSRYRHWNRAGKGTGATGRRVSKVAR